MRTIKFRGKSIETGEWVYGYYVVTGLNIEHCIVEKDMDCSFKNTFIIVDPATVGQYTGKEDKNKEEMYKGDIVEYYYDIYDEYCLVDFHNGGFCLRDNDNDPIDMDYNCFCLPASKDMKKIGNKFDNPELLKKC